ncbi:MAG: hypothetical protein Ct9H300mP31_02250 [Acidimicrobiaceae bacterium]|nr:MAG: hypothetical protein Ct9H300mP31_02250 [Acidimicrobiaceae bacterium]
MEPISRRVTLPAGSVNLGGGLGTPHVESAMTRLWVVGNGRIVVLLTPEGPGLPIDVR